MVKQYSRVALDARSTGPVGGGWRPSKTTMIVAAVLLLACVIPYPYAPSGDFEVLPRGRADVRALTSGDVREVMVKEGDLVKAGQPLARIDDASQKSHVAASQAELASLQADLALARKGARAEEIDVAKQRVATAKTASDVAAAAFNRIAVAYKGKSVTPQDYDKARGAADVAKQQLLEAQRSLALTSSPVQAERIKSIEANVQRAEADLTYAKQDLAYTVITAPMDGRVVSRQLQFSRGQYLDRGAQLATIEDTGELLAEIRMPEAEIGEVKIGAAATAKPWAYPGSSFKGEVRSIAPAAENGEYGKIVRVQVAIADPDNRLKSGMTGTAKVSAGWSLTIVVFTRAIVRFVMIELWSWIP